jgi:hypothetical protein
VAHQLAVARAYTYTVYDTVVVPITVLVTSDTSAVVKIDTTGWDTTVTERTERSLGTVTKAEADSIEAMIRNNAYARIATVTAAQQSKAEAIAAVDRVSPMAEDAARLTKLLRPNSVDKYQLSSGDIDEAQSATIRYLARRVDALEARIAALEAK